MGPEHRKCERSLKKQAYFSLEKSGDQEGLQCCSTLFEVLTSSTTEKTNPGSLQ